MSDSHQSVFVCNCETLSRGRSRRLQALAKEHASPNSQPFSRKKQSFFLFFFLFLFLFVLCLSFSLQTLLLPRPPRRRREFALAFDLAFAFAAPAAASPLRNYGVVELSGLSPVSAAAPSGADSTDLKLKYVVEISFWRAPG